MTKEEVLSELIRLLRSEFEGAVAASQDAADYATNEESRAESQWDTQGLEASYLAAGQAGQARQWAEAIQTLEQHRPDLLAPKTSVVLGALIACDFSGSREHFFIAPAAGGQVVTLDGHEITVVTPQSPIAATILGKHKNDAFTLANGASGSVLEIH